MCTNPLFLKSKGIYVPCNKCFECQKKYSTAWAWRIMEEAKQYKSNCMITLTYSNENLPLCNSLSKRDLQLFMKRLRKFLYPLKVRFFACGEYGSKNARPHYHIILFNYDFSNDRYLFFKSRNDGNTFRSPSLEKLWNLGISSIINLTEDSALYCAKYMQKYFVKPIITDLGKSLFDYSSGQLVRKYFDDGRLVPFVQMSRRPGIGANAYKLSLLVSDKMYRNGKTIKLPRFYWKIAERDLPGLIDDLKYERFDKAKKNKPDYESIDLRIKKLKKVFGNDIDNRGVFVPREKK